MSKPEYYKWHRVFVTKKHCNGTVLRNFLGNSGAWTYEVITDNGEKVFCTRWTLQSEKPIPWFVGWKAHDTVTNQNCEIVEIIGFNSTIPGWIFEIRLNDGQIVRRNELRLTHYKSEKNHAVLQS